MPVEYSRRTRFIRLTPKKLHFQLSKTMQIQTSPKRMQCREIVASNLAASKAYRAQGIDIYVESSPYLGSGTGGGDVYYVTTCDSAESGKVTRLMLADISGHGESAAKLAGSLKSSLKRNVNRISQSSFVQKVNQDFIKTSPSDQMATAVVATFFASQQRLALGMAGHPNPLLFRKSDNCWYKIDEEVVESRNRLDNVPFGICEGSGFPTRNIPVQEGDMFLLYSDAFTESLDSKEEYLGVDGVLRLLNGMTDVAGHELIPTLRKKVRSLNAYNLHGDDATLILGRLSDRDTRPVNYPAPFSKVKLG